MYIKDENAYGEIQSMHIIIINFIIMYVLQYLYTVSHYTVRMFELSNNFELFMGII